MTNNWSAKLQYSFLEFQFLFLLKHWPAGQSRLSCHHLSTTVTSVVKTQGTVARHQSFAHRSIYYHACSIVSARHSVGLP